MTGRCAPAAQMGRDAGTQLCAPATRWERCAGTQRLVGRIVGYQAPVPRSVKDARTWPRADVPSQIDVGNERLAERNALRAHHRLRGHSRPPATGASISEAQGRVADRRILEWSGALSRIDARV